MIREQEENLVADISAGINWAAINPLPTTLPKGDYVFTLVGGVKNDNGRLAVSTIIRDGEFAGKKFTYTYPDFYKPSGAWAIEDFRRLQLALGDDPFEGESEGPYLTRNGGKTFGATIIHRQYLPQDELDVPENYRTVADLKLKSVRAVS